MLQSDFPTSIDDLIEGLESQHYLANRGLSTAIFLALKLERPLLLEGVAGCGKTEVARSLAPLFGSELIRLQCYEGLGTHEALYEWDYARQLLHLRLSQTDETIDQDSIYNERFLLERPLLKALRQSRRPVLLLDELDRADVDFEAFLLEFLEEFQVTIPELGTVKAKHKPIVIITSNRTRELHDALKRRCVYHWVDLPTQAFEEKIINLKLPEIAQGLSQSVAAAVARLRSLDLAKHPGTSEAIDWARSLTLLSGGSLPTADDFESTLSVVLKDHTDHQAVKADVKTILAIE